MEYRRIGELLTDLGYITEEQLAHALEVQKNSDRRLGEILLENGDITELRLAEALSIQLGVKYVDLTKINIPPELSTALPARIARRHKVVPVQRSDDTLWIAMSDPLDFFAIEDVRAATQMRVVPLICTAAAIERALSVMYSTANAARAIADMERSGFAADRASAFGGEDDSASIAPTIRLVNSIIERAADERASDIHLEPRGDDMLVRMRIDGVLQNVLTVPSRLQDSVVARLKVMGNMDIAERRIPQDGRADVSTRSGELDLRLSTLPTIYGEKVAIRLLRKSGGLLTKETIGLSGSDLKKYMSLISANNGAILIVGPTGSGKSSTLYTMIQELNRGDVNLITLEDPVEYSIEGVNQVQINEKSGLTFANCLRSVLRQDPDIICVGEIRDGETAEIAMRAAITGHLVLSTIHTNDAVSTVDRLIDIGVEPFLISTAVKGIISQRLVRRICPRCRYEYTPTEEELSDIGLSLNGAKVYRGAGCPECFNTGYRGRIGVFEILTVDRELRRRINAGNGHIELDDISTSAGHVTLAENCRRLVLEGITTLEEARRTINSIGY